MDYLVLADRTVSFWVQAHVVSQTLSPLMVGLSKAGDMGAVWILIGTVLLMKRRWRRLGIAVFIGLLFSLLVGNGILKHLVMRARPCIDFPWMPLLIQAPTDFSFPSGHTFGSFVAATAIFCGVSRRWGVAVLGLAAGISLSRIYLFVHYPSDVLAGALLGIVFGTLAWRISGKVFVSLPPSWRVEPRLGEIPVPVENPRS